MKLAFKCIIAAIVLIAAVLVAGVVSLAALMIAGPALGLAIIVLAGAAALAAGGFIIRRIFGASRRSVATLREGGAAARVAVKSWKPHPRAAKEISLHEADLVAEA